MAFWAAAAPALISAAGSIAGGLLSKNQGGGAALDSQNQLWLAQQNLQFQADAAQHGIKWRVDDAKDAGIHPLYAVGAPTFNPSPVSMMTSHGGGGGGHDWSGTLGRAGQDIGRAIFSTKTPEERALTAFELQRQQQQLQQGDLQNQLLAAQIAKMTSDQTGPAGPMVGRTGLLDGQPNSGPAVAGANPTAKDRLLGGWDNKRPDVTTVNPTNPTHQSGPAGPSVRWFRSGNGLVSEPLKDSKTEDEFGAPLMAEWLVRNRLAPSLGARDNAPPLGVVQESFPGATGVRWDNMSWKWVPVYGDRYAKGRAEGPLIRFEHRNSNYNPRSR